MGYLPKLDSVLQRMIFVFCIFSAIVAGAETLKRTSRSVEVGSVIIDNQTGNVLRLVLKLEINNKKKHVLNPHSEFISSQTW